MTDFLKRILEAITTPQGLVVVIALVLSCGAVGHSYWVCRNLRSEREGHETYMTGTAAEQSKQIIDALHKVELATQAQTEFNREMRRELAVREAAIAEMVKRIEAIALALEWRAREFQKAALTFMRAVEAQEN